jgi:hypothetical protein
MCTRSTGEDARLEVKPRDERACRPGYEHALNNTAHESISRKCSAGAKPSVVQLGQGGASDAIDIAEKIEV